MEINTRDLEYGYPSLERGIGFVASTHVSFLEVLRYKAVDEDEKVEVLNEKGELREGEIGRWLMKDPKREISRKDGDGEGIVKKKFVGALRLLYGSCSYDNYNHNRLIPLQREDYTLIEERMGLPEQFLPGMTLRTASAFKMSCPISCSQREAANESLTPFRPEACQVLKFSIYRPSYYHIAISHSPSTNITYILLLAKTSDHEFPSLIHSLTRTTLSLQPMYIPNLLAGLCHTSCDRRIQEADFKLNELEEIMGQHEWTNRPIGDPLEMDFLAAGRRLNSIARILGVERMRVLGLLITLGEVRAGNMYKENPDEEIDVGGKIEELIKFHENGCRMMALRVDHQEKRVQSQLAVVYQFMTQKDSKVNIKLAATSATIAKETKKDGSAMKTIAILTMCFLPGTFLAAIFAMPLFNWDDDKSPLIKSRFKYYWAIAIPLTLFVFVVWALAIFSPWGKWMLRWKARSRKGDIEAVEKEE